MTGYGRGMKEQGELRVTVELRAVNHRFLDLQVKLPRAWMALEPSLAAVVRARLGRGRIELFARREAIGASGVAVQVDAALAQAIGAQAEQLGRDLELEGRLTVGELLGFPGVLTTRDREVDAAAEADVVAAALVDALDALVTMRESEGAALAADVLGHLDDVEALHARIQTLAARVPGTISERVHRRVTELLDGTGVTPDPDRLVQEVALLADKAGVDEELVRLASHVAQARELLVSGEPIGRRLDFLVQEFNRETNTIGSKSAESAISGLVVELKSAVEKIREQVANIE
jgi:uncharacterized protein (TIGR00255 family)